MCNSSKSCAALHCIEALHMLVVAISSLESAHAARFVTLHAPGQPNNCPKHLATNQHLQACRAVIYHIAAHCILLSMCVPLLQQSPMKHSCTCLGALCLGLHIWCHSSLIYPKYTTFASVSVWVPSTWWMCPQILHMRSVIGCLPVIRLSCREWGDSKIEAALDAQTFIFA